MNWKKFFTGTAAIAVGTAVALFYAPAILAAEATAVIWAAEAGIGAFSIWGAYKVWQHSQEPVKKQNVSNDPVTVPVQQNTQTKQKELERKKTKLRRWMRAPRLISKWRSKNQQVKNENYRDAA